MKRTRIIALAAVLILVGVVNVHAQNSPPTSPDFIFRVPISLYNIPSEIQRGVVRCAVHDQSGGVIDLTLKDFTIPANGNFSETVVVEVKVRAGRNPRDGKTYMCSFGFRKPDGSIEIKLTQNPSGIYQIAPNTEFRREVRGTIP